MTRVGDSGTVWVGPPSDAADRLRFEARLRLRVQGHLTHAEAVAMAILKENHATLIAMARRLADRATLSDDELSDFLSRVKQFPAAEGGENHVADQCVETLHS